MKQWQRFPNFKQRGDSVELQSMAQAALHGYQLLKPWGDSLEYDVAIEHDGALTRVQVKSTTVRNGSGYFCQFPSQLFGERELLSPRPRPLRRLHHSGKYLGMIPAVVILIPTIKVAATGRPMTTLKKNRYRYEHYREASDLLGKTSRQLAPHAKR